MDNRPHVSFALSDRSYVSLIKKEIKKIAGNIGFSGNRLAEIEIIIAEITSNIIKYSIDGSILVKHFVKGTAEGIEIISIDNGPGMTNVSLMVKDGVSTTRTLGQGLGAIKRLSDNFDIYSVPQWGTILLSRVFKNPEANTTSKEIFNITTLLVPKKGENYCGDGYRYVIKKNSCKILAFDGLGHGPEAQKASEAAIKSFMSTLNIDPGESLRVMNKEIKSTRGGVGMIFSIDLKTNSTSFCGVGNISARILSEGKLKNCISYNGIIGHTFPNSLHTNNTPWNKQDYLILTSDGLKTRWDSSNLTHVLKHDPSIVAASLFKDLSRGNDDSLVIILKCNIKN
ncbi:MAG TPA: ATP-binding protein [Cytophagales bacterium]|nr:ATP-binding protein [Cytophagales bacterium]